MVDVTELINESVSDEVWERVNNEIEEIRGALLDIESMPLPSDLPYEGQDERALRYRHSSAQVVGHGLLAVAELLRFLAFDKASPLRRV